MSKNCCLFLLFSSTLLFCHSSFGQTNFSYMDRHGVNVRVWVGPEDTGAFVNLKAWIDLKNPDTGDEIGFGTKKNYHVGDKTNCNGDTYEYFELDIEENWEATLELFPEVIVTADDVNRYYDYCYIEYPPTIGKPAYEKISDLDFSKNCHGYVFGENCWPRVAAGNLAPGPFVAGSGKTPCFVETSKKDATVAVDVMLGAGPGVVGGSRHSIKVVGGSCEIEDPNAFIPIGGEPVMVTIEVIKESYEKFRASGVYHRAVECPENLSLGDAKCNPDQFRFYK